MFYNLAGLLNAAMVLLSLFGIAAQIRTIWRRKADPALGAPTSRLSLNQFASSYLSYFAVFVYGYSITPFNPYLVWSRLTALCLVLLILYEIWHDRRSRPAAAVLWIALGGLALGLLGLLCGGRLSDAGRHISTALILANAVILAQGGIHQIRVILQAGDAGAVNLRMNQLVLGMHLSTLLFVFAMGLGTGWPLMILALSGGSVKLVVLYLFRWIRVSETARNRRLAAAPRATLNP
ncbi:hypothetical protein BJI67_12520 [Acidihalobacter aeolianus]|uniref:Uncharacterized protein n=1 Tax=Acidihalobacter aeolianus TaxID=2792603 RepID=A0A1D8K9Z0_9GAMM|nr:hypothetical protein [Acidihalobacter aeolianus]AOV17764.1 hypothetical protein BJI67_12520 [Acidihalobacter aeolianus]